MDGDDDDDDVDDDTDTAAVAAPTAAAAAAVGDDEICIADLPPPLSCISDAALMELPIDARLPAVCSVE